MPETARDIGIAQIENALRVGKLAVGMRPYLGQARVVLRLLNH